MPQTITETLSYLLVRICKSHRTKAQELLGEIGLHIGQERLLLRLWMGDGITQTELAEELWVQPATLTRSLNRLARTGLIERRVDAEDQRVSRVYLTDAGRALHEPIEQMFRALEEQSFANMTVEERVLLRRLLLQVYTNLQP
jgi:DNA-binding MarR family transcriptional regulator